MEAQPQQVRRSVKRCRLYLDDVQAIVDVLGAGGGEVEITVPGYGTKDGADALLALNQETLNVIEIRRRQPDYVAVVLGPAQGLVFGSSDDSETLGTVTKIEDIIRRRRRWPSTIAFNPVTFVLLVIAWVAIILGADSATRAHAHWSWTTRTLLFAPLALIAIQCALTAWITLRRYTIIVCARRHNAPSFWKRNRDLIAVGSLTAVIGAVIGALLVKLLG
jgi:hypothetical protein